MLSAQHIYESAPLGSIIRFSNGEPRPPERFRRKLRAWGSHNGSGRLVERHGAFVGTLTRLAPTFTLHIGDYGESGAIILSVSRTFGADSGQTFEIIETPLPGAVRVLTRFDGRDELRHLAPDMADAERWMAQNPYSGMRAEVVPDPDPVHLPDGRPDP